MFSILIPTFNNLDYLKICIESLRKNSNFDHQIIVHVNQGTDGTLEYIKSINIEYTYTLENIGMPKALNLASKKAKHNYILISHDDFYYCPEWDIEFVKEINLLDHNKFVAFAKKHWKLINIFLQIVHYQFVSLKVLL